MMEKTVVTIAPEDIFGLIALAGDAKANYHQALHSLRENDVAAANEAIKVGNETLQQAHAIQTKFITLEAQGQTAEVGVLMVHAQDHLMNTILFKEMLDHMMHMQTEINNLKGMNS